MEISGPVANPSAPTESSAQKGGCIASCVSGCGTALSLVALLVATAAATAFELAQPGHRAKASVADGSCELMWWRAATGGGRYRITCWADRDLTVQDFKLLSGPSGVPLVESVEDWGQHPWEDQRPLSNEVIEIEGQTRWRYDGTISLGPVPYVGPEATVTLWADLDDERVELRAVQ